MTLVQTARHGTRSKYVRGCRCEPCKESNRDYDKARKRARNGRKTHCVRGHLFDEENTAYDRRGYRACRACRAAANRGSRPSPNEIVSLQCANGECHMCRPDRWQCTHGCH